MDDSSHLINHSAITGALLGTALGDALGLPYEGMSARRGARMFPDPTRFHFALGRGMGSDDTDHACLALEALCSAGTDPDRFAADFARRLRWWLVGVPAGIGYATLRAGVRSWLGWSPRTSGVASAGNGAAMRVAVLGAAVDRTDVLVELVRASTAVTHRDPRALYGALAVALAAAAARRGEPDALVPALDRVCADATARESFAAVERAVASAVAGEPTSEFARSIGCERGVSGYVLHTVPVAIHAWRSAPRDWLAVVTGAIRCGGDADTVAAIAGGIAGAGVGTAGIPGALLAHYADRPRSVAWMERLSRAAAQSMATGVAVVPPRASLFTLWPRNALFLGVVLAHAVRRALPPY